MAKKTKALKQPPKPKENPNPYLIDGQEYRKGIFDLEDSYLAIEHYLYYVLVPSTGKGKEYTRYYLSKSKKDEYGKIRSGKPQKYYPLDDHPEKTHFIQECINIYGKELRKNAAEIKGFTSGLDLFCQFLDTQYCKEHISEPGQISRQTQIGYYQWAAVKPLRKIELSYSFHFIKVFAQENGFNATLVGQSGGISTPAYPSDVVYLLDINCRAKLKESTSFFKDTKALIDRVKSMGELFTVENLLHTRYALKGKGSSSYAKQFDKMLKRFYGIEAKQWYSNGNHIFKYRSEKNREEHQRLIEIAKNGKDISHNSPDATIELKLYWFFKAFPDWPYSREIDSQYDGILQAEYYQFAVKLGIDYKGLISRYFFPTADENYPLYLLLAIRTGKNPGVIQNYKLEQDDEGAFTLGEFRGSGNQIRVIYSVKDKTNTESKTYLGTDSQVDKWINIMLEWFTPVYKMGELKHFFSAYGQHAALEEFTMGRINRASQRFLASIEDLITESNIPLTNVNHTRLRPSHNVAQYFRGLKEFERQQSLEHRDEETQRSYENSVELMEHKHLLIAKGQYHIEQLFRGAVVEVNGKRLAIGKGAFADCRNPQEPSHEGKPKLKEDEVCNDWTMCLGCDKCEIYKPLHGPVIAALHLYLKAQEEAMATLDWEKEYSEIATSVESVWGYKFSEQERAQYLSEAGPYELFVKTVFMQKRKRKVVKGDTENAQETA